MPPGFLFIRTHPVAALVLYFTAQMPEAERGAAQPHA